MKPADLDRLADELFASVAGADLDRVAALYDPAVQVWHNVTQKTQTREENLRLLEHFTSRVTGRRYEVHSRDFFPDGFVQRHTLHGKTASGETIAVPVCIVIHAEDGRIQRLYEYLDAAAVEAAFS